MPTRKLEDGEAFDFQIQAECRDADHAPTPRQQAAFGPGRFEHTCPSCGTKTWFATPANLRQG